MSTTTPVGDREVPLERSLPRLAYVDETFFSDEVEAVLSRDWICVCRAESLAGPGDYLAVEAAGESIVLVRGGEGEISAFYNLCRHRGSRLVPPGGPAGTTAASGCFGERIRCPYHGWTYALDGRLRAAPFLPELKGLKEGLSLHGVATLTWGGFVFVRLEPPTGAAAGESGGGGAPAPLPESLRGPDERLRDYGLAELRTGRRLCYEVAANWKVILENYNECYHCGPVHPELCELVPAFRRGGAGLDWEAGIPHREGAFTFTTTGTTTRAPLPRLSGEKARVHRGELILPNLMLSCSADHVAAFTLRPVSAGATTVVCDFLFHPDELEKSSFDPDDAVEFWDVVNRQDWRICEQVQDGMGSRRFSFGYLAPMEQPSADVGRYVAARLGLSPGSSASGTTPVAESPTTVTQRIPDKGGS